MFVFSMLEMAYIITELKSGQKNRATPAKNNQILKQSGNAIAYLHNIWEYHADIF